MQRVTIVGSGFAALTAVRKLRQKDPGLEITLVSPRAEFHYLPGTIWIPSGIREPSDLIIPLDNFFRRMRVNHRMTEATGLSNAGRTLICSDGELENDGLIICSGGRFIKKLPGIEHAITPCEGIEATLRIRQRLQQMESGSIAIGFAGNPKEPSAMRGGPMFEFLFGIDRQLRLEKRRDKALIVVKDNGSGISDEMRDKVFRPNFTTKSSGTGLGLAISAKIVETFNGRIYFETEEGKGTKFFIEIPLMKLDDNLKEEQRVLL